MATTPKRTTTRDTLHLRIRPELRGLIDRAAQLAGKNRTEFVLEAARRAAEDALLDRTVFNVSSKAYAEFLKRLDVPPQPNDRLRHTMQARSNGLSDRGSRSSIWRSEPHIGNDDMRWIFAKNRRVRT